MQNSDLKEKSQKAQFYSGLMMPVMQNLNTLNYVFITIVGALLAIFRGFDVGGLEHVQDSCFSGSGGTDQGYFAAGPCMQGDSFQNRFLRFVSEINVFHGYVALYML